jgi:uncharacterized peroxidase-related enzyme
VSRIPTPSNIASAPAASRPILKAVKKQLGVATNMFPLISNSPAALEGYVGLSAALNTGKLAPQTRERIALAIAELNGCDYCLSAHTYLGKNLAKLADAEITANRSGACNDPKADAAARFAAKVSRERGHVSAADVEAVKAAGYDDAQVIEIVLHVALTTWMNFVNEVSGHDRHRFPHHQGPQRGLTRALAADAFAVPAALGQATIKEQSHEPSAAPAVHR